MEKPGLWTSRQTGVSCTIARPFFIEKKYLELRPRQRVKYPSFTNAGGKFRRNIQIAYPLNKMGVNCGRKLTLLI